VAAAGTRTALHADRVQDELAAEQVQGGLRNSLYR